MGVQILGAEKALFRALKTRGNTPKYGLIFHSSFIGRAGAKNKGRISRYLANKCSIASRIDCFSENSTTIFGSSMKQQVEDRLKFYESGDLPRKNVDVMSEAMTAADEEAKANKKKEKKEKKKRKIDETVNGGDTTLETSQLEDASKVEDETEQPPKKKKRRRIKKRRKKMVTLLKLLRLPWKLLWTLLWTQHRMAMMLPLQRRRRKRRIKMRQRRKSLTAQRLKLTVMQ